MPDEMSRPWFRLCFITIASDHDKTEAFQSKSSKTLSVFDDLDYFLRDYALSKNTIYTRAIKDELHEELGAALRSIVNDSLVIMIVLISYQ